MKRKANFSFVLFLFAFVPGECQNGSKITKMVVFGQIDHFLASGYVVDPSPTDPMLTTTAMDGTTTIPSETTKVSTTAQTSTPVTTPGDDSWMDDTGVWLVTGLFYRSY